MSWLVAGRRCVFSPHHSALSGVVEPLQQLDGGALSTAAAPHQGQSFSLLHAQIQASQDWDVRPRRIVKLHTLKAHVTIKCVLGSEREEGLHDNGFA